MRIFFHRIGTPQRDDELVYGAPEPDWFPYATVSDDGRYLIIFIERGTAENQLHLLDLTEPGDGFRPLVPDFASKAIMVGNVGTTCYLVTDYAAERQRLVAVDLGRPGREHWREIIGESSDTLLAAHFYGGTFVCHYLRDAHSVLRVHALDGAHVRDIPLPGFASVAENAVTLPAIKGSPGSDMIHFEVTSFTESGAIWSHDLRAGQTTLIRPSAAKFDSAAFVTEQVHAPSADGTPVPMFLTRRGLAADGKRRCCFTPTAGSTSRSRPVPSRSGRRGWTRAACSRSRTCAAAASSAVPGTRPGVLGSKQNVFDDFCGRAVSGRRRLVPAGASRSPAGLTGDCWSARA